MTLQQALNQVSDEPFTRVSRKVILDKVSKLSKWNSVELREDWVSWISSEFDGITLHLTTNNDGENNIYLNDKYISIDIIDLDDEYVYYFN